MRLRKIQFAAFLFISVSAVAADGFKNEELLNLQVMARFDYQRYFLDGSSDRANCGFRGKNLSVYLHGNLNSHLSYACRQRLNRAHKDETFFDATDFLYLAYKTDSDWKFSAGKQTILLGGYEYDLAPIDSYFVSEYSNNMNCYQLGASVEKTLGEEKNDLLQFQFCMSPYVGAVDNKDIYSYNFMWTAEHGVFQSMWSLNFVEYQSGKFMNYISLGNNFSFRRVSFFVDVMHRSLLHNYTFFKDFTVVGKVTFDLCDRARLFVKAGHDYNNLKKAGDWSVLPGTSIARFGCGFEFFPLKDNKDLRLHAVGSHNTGKNTNPAGTLLDKQSYLSVGLTWRMNLLKFRR